MKNIKKYFASANTGDGFICRFDEINQGGFTYVIKGGSGTGKSSLMKKVGEHFLRLGYSVEYFYCSSDTTSLDGVKIVEKGVALVDGTAPHVREVALPAVNGKIVNVGEFIGESVQKYAEKLLSLKGKKERGFFDAYKYLFAAKNIHEIICNACTFDCKTVEKNLKKARTILKSAGKNEEKKGAVRNLFGSVFSSNSNSEFYSANGYKKIVLEGNCLEQEISLKKISELFENSNEEIIRFYSPIKADYLEGVLLSRAHTVFLADYFSLDESEPNKLFAVLIERAKESMLFAMSYHKEMEKYYVEAMDFSKVDKLIDKLICEIESRT